MKSTLLPPDHYAAGWGTGELRTHAEINSLGKRYAETHGCSLRELFWPRRAAQPLVSGASSRRVCKANTYR